MGSTLTYPTNTEPTFIYTDSLWAETFLPIPNPIRPGQGFDYGRGSCWFTFVDMQQYVTEHDVPIERVWIIEQDCDDVFFVNQGDQSLMGTYYSVHGYMITEKAPEFSLDNAILVI